MFFCEQVNMISIVKNIFTVVCLAISLVLIVQLLYVFVEEKPTTTTNLDEQLEITDLPEVVICLNPGFNNAASVKYGYNSNVNYWRGYSPRAKQFVGWNGDRYGVWEDVVKKNAGKWNILSTNK